MGKQLRETELDRLITEATVDAYGDEEQLPGLHAAIAEHLAVPFRRLSSGSKSP
jgi:hypothetical protein